MQPMLKHDEEHASFSRDHQDLMRAVTHASDPASCTIDEVSTALNYLDDHKDMNKFTVALFAWPAGAALLKPARELVSKNQADSSNQSTLKAQIPLLEVANEGIDIGESLSAAVLSTSLRVWVNTIDGPCKVIGSILKVSSSGFRAQVAPQRDEIALKYCQGFDQWFPHLEQSVTKSAGRFNDRLRELVTTAQPAVDTCESLVEFFGEDVKSCGWVLAAFLQCDILMMAIEKNEPVKYTNGQCTATMVSEMATAFEAFAKSRKERECNEAWLEAFQKTSSSVRKVAKWRRELSSGAQADTMVKGLLKLWDEVFLPGLKEVATAVYSPQKLQFEARLLHNGNDWTQDPNLKRHPVYDELQEDSAQTTVASLLNFAAHDEALDVVSQTAAILEKFDDVSEYTVSAAQDKVRRAAVAAIASLRQWKTPQASEVPGTLDLAACMRMHDLFCRIESYKGVIKDQQMSQDQLDAQQNFVDRANSFFDKVVRQFTIDHERKLAGAIQSLSSLFPEDWLTFCFREIQREKAKEFINSPDTNLLGKQSTTIKNFLNQFSDFAFSKAYLVNWASLVQRGAEPGVHPAGLFVQCTDEVASARRALAGAKCAKTVLFTVPKLVGKDDEKKKKRDAVKSARESIRSMGVETGFPAEVLQALSSL